MGHGESIQGGGKQQTMRKSLAFIFGLTSLIPANALTRDALPPLGAAQL